MQAWKVLAAAAMPLILLAGRTQAADTSGNAALSLAALVGAESSALAKAQKKLLVAYLNSHPDAAGPAAPFVVTATKVSCRSGNVNITDHQCDLTFDKGSVKLDGRSAQQLFATMVLAGVAAEGAAGKAIAEIDNLSCSIDPKGVKSEDGSGAKCAWK